MIIVVGGIKGGSGKTTIATNLAIMRAKDGCDVLLVDADSQMSSSDFIAVREQEHCEPRVSSVNLVGKSIYEEVTKLELKYDDIIIDVGGRDSATLRSAILAANVLIVPCLPSQLDVWAIEYMDTVVKEALKFNEKLRSFVFLNKVDSNPKINMAQETEEILVNCKNISLSSVKIGARIAFRRAIAEGVSVLDLQSSKKDKKAIEEMKILYKESFLDA